jgi:hypothetical protein
VVEADNDHDDVALKATLNAATLDPKGSVRNLANITLGSLSLAVDLANPERAALSSGNLLNFALGGDSRVCVAGSPTLPTITTISLNQVRATGAVQALLDLAHDTLTDPDKGPPGRDAAVRAHHAELLKLISRSYITDALRVSVNLCARLEVEGSDVLVDLESSSSGGADVAPAFELHAQLDTELVSVLTQRPQEHAAS